MQFVMRRILILSECVLPDTRNERGGRSLPHRGEPFGLAAPCAAPRHFFFAAAFLAGAFFAAGFFAAAFFAVAISIHSIKVLLMCRGAERAT